MRPFVSWVGSKSKLLKKFDFLFPQKYNNFIEPFVGSGAAFLFFQPSQLIVNDINQELITAYQTIKDNPQELIKLLTEYKEKHGQEFYERVKKHDPKNLNSLETAARFIYLNKTCYNGLYRVNSQGVFNVPWGKKEKVNLFDEKNILAISEYLKKNNCQIFSQNYQELLSLIKEGDFLFVDPPYDSETGRGFTSYSAGNFNRKNQKELFDFLKECEKQGAKWFLTNHATSFIKELYKDYWQFTAKSESNIESQETKSTQEVFICNYQLTKDQEMFITEDLEVIPHRRETSSPAAINTNRKRRHFEENISYIPLTNIKKTHELCVENECYWKKTPYSDKCFNHTHWYCDYNPNNFNIDDASESELKTAINNLRTIINTAPPTNEVLFYNWNNNRSFSQKLLEECENKIAERVGNKEKSNRGEDINSAELRELTIERPLNDYYTNATNYFYNNHQLDLIEKNSDENICDNRIKILEAENQKLKAELIKTKKR